MNQINNNNNIDQNNDDLKKYNLLNEINEDSIKITIIKSMVTDELKIKSLDTLKYDWDKYEVIKSLKNDNSKIKCLNLLEDPEYDYKIMCSLKNDNLKLKIIDSLNDEDLKTGLIKSLHDDNLKLEKLKLIKDATFKYLIVKSIYNDEKKFQCLQYFSNDSINEEWKRNIIKSLKDDKLKIKSLKNLSKDRFKVDVIQTLSSDDLKIDCLTMFSYTDYFSRSDIIKSLTNDRLKIQYLNLFSDASYLGPIAKMRIMKSLTNNELKINNLDSLIKEDDKKEIINTLSNDEKVHFLKKTKDIALKENILRTINNNQIIKSNLSLFKPILISMFKKGKINNDDNFNQNTFEYLSSLDKDILSFVFNDVQNKILSEYSKISDDISKNTFRDYIIKNIDIITIDNISIATSLLNKLTYSNSLELFNFRDTFANQLLKTNDPIGNLSKIEQIFLSNNLPLFGKMFLTFQTLYPDLNNNIFDFTSDSRVSPQLKDDMVPKMFIGNNKTRDRFAVIFNDLFRISYRTGERSLIEYLDNIDKGNDIYLGLINKKIDINTLSKSDMDTLNIFVSHLEVMFANTLKGKDNNINLSNLSLGNKVKLLANYFEPNERYSLKDRIIRSFCHTAGVDSYSSLIDLIKKARNDSLRQTANFLESFNNNDKFNFAVGDYVRAVGTYREFGSMLDIGNICKEHLGSVMGTSYSDMTPLDVDLSRITNISDIYHSIENTPTGFGYGNIYVIFKKDNPNLNLTRDIDNNIVNMTYDPKKLEIFKTGSGNHYGIRTGFAFTDIDAILYKKRGTIDPDCPYDNKGNINYKDIVNDIDDLPIIKFELARVGLYIPIIDFSGKLIYTKNEYNNLREKMQGLSYYKVNNYNISDNLLIPGVENIINGIGEDSFREINNKREYIYKIANRVLKKKNLKLKRNIDGDLTPGSIEMIDTGSTGRNTNIPYEGDFDFYMRLDANIMKDPDKLNRFKESLSEELKKYNIKEFNITSSGDFRCKEVEINDQDYVDIDISFGVKTNKVNYSSDICLKDRLNTINTLYPDKYKYVIANIILAKKILKDAHIYKPNHAREAEGGLGGIGIENWILQNGGSFIDAARGFIQASTNKNFEEFKDSYEIWDFGSNHFSMRNDSYPHNNFIKDNMSNNGYKKMVNVLEDYVKKYDQSFFKDTSNGISR